MRTPMTIGKRSPSFVLTVALLLACGALIPSAHAAGDTRVRLESLA